MLAAGDKTKLMSNLKDALHIPDTQSARDERHLAIQRVGVKSVRYPLLLRVGDAAVPTVGLWDLDVALPAEAKGTHMSRFVAWLDALDAPLDATRLRSELAVMLDKLHASEGRIDAQFPFFLRKRAPVSGVQSLLEYQGRWIAEAREGITTGDDKTVLTTVWAEVVVPVKSLCPCSKEISDYGAHNQRSHVTVTARTNEFVWIEEIVDIVERQGSSELYGLLKRPDEKFVTERAYDNPKFVEDLVRDVASVLNLDERIEAYVVESENFESIHNHSAYALIEKNKRAK